MPHIDPRPDAFIMTHWWPTLGAAPNAVPINAASYFYPEPASYPTVKLFCPRCEQEMTHPLYGMPGPVIYRCRCGWDSTQPADVAAASAPPEQPEATP